MNTIKMNINKHTKIINNSNLLFLLKLIIIAIILSKSSGYGAPADFVDEVGVKIDGFADSILTVFGYVFSAAGIIFLIKGGIQFVFQGGRNWGAIILPIISITIGGFIYAFSDEIVEFLSWGGGR